MNKEILRKYFSENLARKLAAFVLLISFNMNIFAEAVPDPVSIGNARATRTASGIEQLDIATPNAKGLSYNSLLELQVSERGLILNNNPHVVADTQIAGLVARNRNLDRSGSASLIVTEITGKNRTNINGHVEVAGDRADIVMANRNGITVNGGGFLNSGRVTLTSGKLNISGGELKSIDVESGNVRIGEKGIDALSLTDLELVAKTVDIDGIVKGSRDTKVRISAGGQTYEYRTKEVASKGKTYSGIAVDGKSAGSMHAGKIDIISNDKGAGVNTKGSLVSIDDVTITASGDVTTRKAHSKKRVVYRTPRKVRITKQVTAGEKVAVRAKKTEVDVNAQVITGYLKKSLGEDAFEAKSDEVNIYGKIEANGKVVISGKSTRNAGQIRAADKVSVNGETLDNSRGEIRSDGKVELNTRSTVNRQGYILSDGLAKEDAARSTENLESGQNAERLGNTSEAGVSISGDLDNTKGVVKGREVGIGGSLNGNRGGLVRSMGDLAVNGSVVDNAGGRLEGLAKTTVNAGHISNAGGKIASGGIVELSTPNEYTYEGTVEGKALTTINGGKITVNDRIERSGALELIAQNGMTLNNDVTARILNIQTNANLDNSHSLKGNEYLSVKAGNVTNNGRMLSDKYVYVKADGRLANGPAGRTASNGDSFLEAQAIENNRGSILANGTLTMIADTLIRNDLGRIHSGTGTYGVVRNGRLENIGQSNVEIIENVNSDLGASGVPSRTGRFRTRSPRVQNILNDRPTYTMNASSESSDITSDGFIALDVNGDVINRDAGNIEAKGIAQIKANNVYNISRMATSQDGNTVLVGAGGRIAGSEVYLDVAGKVVNGIEDSLGNTYRREDGVLVDNRNVVSAGQSVIAGTNETAIKAGSVINTAQIGENGKGATFIDTQGTISNTAMGGNAAKIEGNTVTIDGKAGVTNTGSVIEGTKGTQVTSSNGQVINESTIQSETVYKNADTGRSKLIRLISDSTPQIDRVTESIRNVGKIESGNGLVYVEGDRGVVNVAANLRGAEGTYIVGKNGTIEDRAVSLRDLRNGVVETKTETREVRKAGLGRRSRGAARTEEVQVQTRWDIVDRADTVSGIIGMGKNTVLEGKDILLASSDLRATDDVVLNAKNHILMLSTVDTEYKHRTETHKSGRIRKKTTTENWTEDNEYANNVDITTNGNILLNYHGAGAPADNKGIFAQGVNFNTKGQVLGLSEGDIYIQGTKDRLNSVYTSKTKKSFAGIGYKKSSDYVNTYQERYKLGQLYGDAGITYDADGKLRVEGVDVQSSGKTFFRGKMGLEILPGTENGYRYEEHKSSGLTASLGLSWSGLSAGVGYQKSVDRIAETTKTIVPNKTNVAGEVVLETEKGNIDFYPTTGAAGKLVFNANGNEINILDMQNERTYDRQTQKSYVGIGANLGIPMVSSLQQVWEAGRGLRHARSKEDYINGGSRLASAGAGTLASYGELFTNPISSGVSLNYSNSRSSQHREESVSVGSNLYVANGVEYNGSNLHTRGLNIQNDGDTVYNLTGSIIKEAGKSTIRETSSSTGYGISLAKGLTDGKGTINPLKSSNITASVNASEYRGRSNGVYYANNQDVTKGNSHYNVAGDVKVTGVDVKTGSVSGTVGGKMTVESVQDEFTSEGRGYSAGISAGIGKGFDRNNPKGYGANLSSISAGHTRTDMEQRITRNVTEFTAGSGFLDVKGTVRQVGSLVDGNFTLNSGGYEHEDLKDIDKSRTVGINVTVYPNVSYSQRDKNGNQVYVDGSNPKKTGTAVKTGLTYGETDKTREILATVGAGVTMNQNLEGVNRNPDRQTTEFEGRELKPVNVDLLTEYWATEAGRGKLKDLIENSERTTDGIKRILTTRDENGNLNILKSVEAESAVQKFMRIGYVDTRGKTQQQVKQELEARFGSLAKKGVEVYFYGEKDVDTSNLDNATKTKLLANGFAITEDGTVWINKEHVDSGKVIDFNTLTQHEISHIIFGKDSEYQAQYVEAAYREFLTGLARNGYAQNGSGITDYDNSMLTVQEIARLNGYTDEEMQKFVNEFMEGLIGKQKWRNIKNGVQANVKRVPIVGNATSKILTKVSQIDRKIAPKAGMKAGRATGNGVKTVVKAAKRTGDKIAEVKKNIEKAQKERAERKRIASQKKEKEKAQEKERNNRIFNQENPINLSELKEFMQSKGRVPKNTKYVLEFEDGRKITINSQEEFKHGTPEELMLEKKYTDLINDNFKAQEIAKKNKNFSELKKLQEISARLHQEQRAIYGYRSSPFGQIGESGDMLASVKSYKNGTIVLNGTKYAHEVGSDWIAVGMDLGRSMASIESGLASFKNINTKPVNSSASRSSVRAVSVKDSPKIGSNETEGPKTVYVNDGTPGGTSITEQMRVMDSRRGLQWIGEKNYTTGQMSLRGITPSGQVMYEFSATGALKQIGNTVKNAGGTIPLIGYNGSTPSNPLVNGQLQASNVTKSLFQPPKYPVVSYNPNAVALSRTNYFKTQPLVNLVENPKLTVPIIGNKLNYVFGEATGRKHNLERTNEMVLTLKGIGINNDTLGRKVVYNNLVNTFHNPHSVINRESYYNPYDGITYNKTEREAFLMGPAGGVKISSIWWDNELKTVKIYGHRNKAGE